MTANAYAATSGTLLYYGDSGAADPATALAGIKQIGALPKIEADEFEITRVDQMDGAIHDWFKQFAPDHVDPGTMELTLALNETQLETLYAMIRVTKAWKILFSSGGDLIFEGFVKAVGPEAEDKGEIVVKITIRVTGKPVFSKYVAA